MNKFNHKTKFEGLQPAFPKSIIPGMLITFKYTTPTATDKNPVVLVMYNDYYNKMIEGLNLNYISYYKITKLVDKLIKGAGVYSPKGSNIVQDVDLDEESYDDDTPYRNLLHEPHTRIDIPAFRMEREGNPLSKSEAKRQMKILYEKVVKKVVHKQNIYRSYKIEKMRTLKAIQFDI